VIRFRIGGRTILFNILSLCKHHHRVKHMPGWDLKLDPDGTAHWTTPAGETYTTYPPWPGDDDAPDFASLEPESDAA
jgi:hypothetical protein